MIDNIFSPLFSLRYSCLCLASLSIRHAHTDIQIPSFDYYRRKVRIDPAKSYRDAGDTTAPYSYLAPIGKCNGRIGFHNEIF